MLVDPRLVDADLQYNLRERVAPSLVCEWRVHRVCRVADARRRVEGPPLRLFRRIRLPVSCLHATVTVSLLDFFERRFEEEAGNRRMASLKD